MQTRAIQPAKIRWWLTLLALVLGGVMAWFWLRRSDATVVPIQDGQTIDFSSGRAEVRNDAADRAALAKAKQEMDAATADITFAPTKPTEPKK